MTDVSFFKTTSHELQDNSYVILSLYKRIDNVQRQIILSLIWDNVNIGILAFTTQNIRLSSAMVLWSLYKAVVNNMESMLASVRRKFFLEHSL